MESLLRLSGQIPNEDADATDLGTLEKRLAEKTAALQREGTPSNRNSTSAQSKDGSSNTNTPQATVTSPDSTIESPEAEKEGKTEEEVEALSDMMCSLVTNNCGETRYIGRYLMGQFDVLADFHRLVFWLFHFLAQGDSMGERKDWRQFLSGDDLHGIHR